MDKNAIAAAVYWFLAILLVVLKLAGVVNWAWVFVLSPIWVPMAFAAVLALVFAALLVVLGLLLVLAIFETIFRH
jgi:hypothetical protein